MSISRELFEQAVKVIPGGVNSPVRTCAGVGADPLFISRAQGPYIYTEDGQKMVDYVMSWGPMILGHNHEAVNRALHEAVDRGTSYGAPCRPEIDLAGLIVEALPGVDMVRMVNSGTEATMSALRLARGYTGRPKVLKFTGCYHGHVDSFLASAGSGAATLCIPGTPGVPEEVVAHTLLADYNDLEQVQALFAEHGQEIAAIFVEPVAGNMGLVLPRDGFLQGLRKLADEYGSLLVFDEVITGFRVSFSGAQGRFKVIPDLTCLGKIIGGGLPVGAYGGRREIMEKIAPCGEVYQAGTLSGNPLAMTAGYHTLKTLQEMDYDQLEARTGELAVSLRDILAQKGVPVQLNTIGSIFTLFFSDAPVTDFASAKKADQDLFRAFYNGMRDQGIYLAPSGFECAFNSFAHSALEWEKTLEAARRVSFSR
ncbi:glutamate-1-semialdehyde 2,1-aminomutase [Desulfonatronovibrio hydrogenovorans]|uniref:glutamate-1-semialdehyde 2,1-aminomutase n=1 Tax=Desulfonatronovibrio hydrogenovorans TaxID=53245 RepID=UPI00048D1529|nr:glutamate-1-semialdehyde 2,1-aminomutase [Desulfonatronovibrio hydrogenovorans]